MAPARSRTMRFSRSSAVWSPSVSTRTPPVSRPCQRASQEFAVSGESSIRSASALARATRSPASPSPAGRISTPARCMPPSSAGTSIVGELPAGTTPPASGFDGHQARSPSSTVMAGTTARAHDEGVDQHPERDREPELEQQPHRQRGEDDERAGQDQAGARDHRAGRDDPAQDPLARAAQRRLLADAAHEEDVVVDPERDEEDEREDRQQRVDAVAPEDDVEREQRQPERAEVAQDHRREQVERRHQRAQQHDQDDQDHPEHERRDHQQVALGGHALVMEARGAVADLHAQPAADVVGRLAERLDAVERVGPERVLVEHEPEAGDRPVGRARLGRREDGEHAVDRLQLWRSPS